MSVFNCKQATDTGYTDQTLDKASCFICFMLVGGDWELTIDQLRIDPLSQCVCENKSLSYTGIMHAVTVGAHKCMFPLSYHHPSQSAHRLNTPSKASQ